MIRRALALLPVLLLAACHRGDVADVTLDADRAAENATAAKTVADLAAAEAESREPLPPRRTAASAADNPASPDAVATEAPLQDGNGEDAAPE